jgi:hypothetical protein
MKFFPVLLACCLLVAPGPSGVALAEDEASSAHADRAMEVLRRTKTFEGTYSLYIWNRITLPNKEPVEEWSAEFHLGHLHRVETPRDRLVADCRARTGIALSLMTGEFVEGPEVAAAACGINTNFDFAGIRWLGRIETVLGTGERIRVMDRDNVRQYDVSDVGVLLATTYAENLSGQHVLLMATGFKLSADVPNVAMFDRNSLRASFVAEEYRTGPK